MQALAWTVIRRLHGVFQGDHETLFHGVGIRMSDIREYQPGDDVRHLDWNVSARTGMLHVRTFHEERELTAWFLVDVSASLAMASPGSPASARQVAARQVIGALAGLLVRHGDRIGAMFDDGRGELPIRMLPPAGARSQVVRLLDMFDAQAMRTRASDPKQSARSQNDAMSGGTPLAPLLDRACAVIGRRSLVVLVSDFHAAQGWETSLRRLAQRHEVLCIRIHDPVQAQLPDMGLITVEDSESGEQCLVDTSDPVIRSRYADIMAQRRQALMQTCAVAGADLLELGTDESLLHRLMHYLAWRKRRRHLPSASRSPTASATAPASASAPASAPASEHPA